MPRWTFVSFMAEWKKLPPYTAQREHLFFFVYVIFVQYLAPDVRGPGGSGSMGKKGGSRQKRVTPVAPAPFSKIFSF